MTPRRTIALLSWLLALIFIARCAQENSGLPGGSSGTGGAAGSGSGGTGVGGAASGTGGKGSGGAIGTGVGGSGTGGSSSGGASGQGGGLGGFIGRTGAGGFGGRGAGGFTASGSTGGHGGTGGLFGGGQGGLAGSSAGGTGGTIVGCPRTSLLIDNFDDPARGGPPNGAFFNFNCGAGYWYDYTDSSPQPPAQIVPSPSVPFTSSMPGNGGAGYAAHVSASGFATVIGLAVAAVMPANGSAYSGFTFWAKGAAAGSQGASTVRVLVPIPATTTVAEGGTCVGGASGYCDGHWGRLVPITATWAQYLIRWSDLTLPAGAMGGPTFDPSALLGVHWEVLGAAGMPASMDLWIDDLAFAP